MRPASSINMWYENNQDVNSEKWTLKSTIRVKESADNTYFAALGYSPGGYAGIQQLSGNRRVAIFSLWCFEERECPTKVRNGNGVTVSNFGGEGTGLKAIMDNFPWRENQNMVFTVEGRLVKQDAWDEVIQIYPNEHFSIPL